MARRKLIRSGSTEETLTESIVGGPKMVFRKRRVRRIFTKKIPLQYEPINAEWYVKLLEEIHLARLKKGLSQAAVAKSIKTTQSEISSFENGKNNPTVEFIERVRSLLGIEINIKS